MNEKKFKLGNAETTVIVVGIMLMLMFAYNGVRMSGMSAGGGAMVPLVSASDVVPTGIPNIYGSELGISYDDVSSSTPQQADATIGLMSKYDRSLTLTGDNLKRYIDVTTQISCEYCCGAAAITFSDGKAACGCAHSFAMRGLAKYLITEHGSEFTNDEILSELGKWKVLFFPGIHENKAAVMKSQGIETNYINLASNKYRDIEKGAPAKSSGGMVGGC